MKDIILLFLDKSIEDNPDLERKELLEIDLGFKVYNFYRESFRINISSEKFLDTLEEMINEGLITRKHIDRNLIIKL